MKKDLKGKMRRIKKKIEDKPNKIKNLALELESKMLKKDKDNENEMLNKDKDDLGKNLIEFGDKNENYNFNLDTDKNPFTNVLIGGGVTAGAGIGVAGGSIAACIAFDSVFLGSVAGEIYAAGISFLGGVAFTGIGLVIVIPSLLGFGIYKIYKSYKDK